MEIPNLTLTLSYIFFSFILVAINAFFVASEFAVVKVRRTRLEELAGKGNAQARISLLCVDQLDEYLSATQLGITMVSLGLGWIGEESFFNLFVILFPEHVGIGTGTFHGIAAGFSFFIITLLHVVLGELVPKNMAIQNAERITLLVSRSLHLFYVAAKPLINMFTALANLVLRCLGYRSVEELPLSEEELKLVMKDSREEGIITESEAQIINRAFSFSDKRAIDMMIPAEKVEYLSLARTFGENMAVTRNGMHTRFPLTCNGFNTVTGIVHMKDVFHHLGDQKSNVAFEEVASSAIFVDRGLTADKLMKLLKERQAHLAIVQDVRTKTNIGIVTMEDILEELVGEIRDEYGH